MEDKKNEMLTYLSILKIALKDAKIKTEDFYLKMRYEKLGLSSEEYDKLFESGKIYELEENDIFELFERLEKALNNIL